MASTNIYRVNENLLGEQLLPPDKRLNIFSNYLNSLLIPAQYLNNLNAIFREGSLPSLYSNVTTYSNGSIVLGWFNFTRAIFLSLINNNLNKPLTDTTSWLLIVDNFIGVNERLLYNGNKLVLEWALNKYFGTIFRQPPNIPDIYINDNDANYKNFFIANNFYIAGEIFNDESRGYIINQLSPVVAASEGLNFSIYFPLSLYITLPGWTGPGSVDGYITNFVNNYISAGLTYNIITY